MLSQKIVKILISEMAFIAFCESIFSRNLRFQNTILTVHFVVNHMMQALRDTSEQIFQMVICNFSTILVEIIQIPLLFQYM